MFAVNISLAAGRYLLVGGQVAVEGVGVGEGLVAHQTGLHVLPRVRPHVVLQLLLLGEDHAAYLACLSFFTFF